MRSESDAEDLIAGPHARRQRLQAAFLDLEALERSPFARLRQVWHAVNRLLGGNPAQSTPLEARLLGGSQSPTERPGPASRGSEWIYRFADDWRQEALLLEGRLATSEARLKRLKEQVSAERLLGTAASRKALRYKGQLRRLSRRTLEVERELQHSVWRAQAHGATEDDVYAHWRKDNAPRAADFLFMEQTLGHLGYQPLISILVPVFNPPIIYLQQMLRSVREQVYPNWELCIADDASSDPSVRTALENFAAENSRTKIVFRAKNGHIVQASNSALDLVTGEFVGLLDHDDLLTRDALFQVVFALNECRNVDMFYSDEDKIDDKGRLSNPYFKPDWAPDSFLSRNYTSHFGVYRTRLVRELGGFREGFEGSQDYDLVLRLTERTDEIVHLPNVLYHWRIHPQSASSGAVAKPYAYTAAKAALSEALERRAEPGKVRELDGLDGAYEIDYDLVRSGKISIIIPTRDHAADVDKCLHSIFSLSTYQDFEIILVDNGSAKMETLEAIKKWKRLEPQRFIVLPCDVPFNYSRINNYAAARSTGEYLLFVNNDTEVISSDWLQSMLKFAQRPSVGAVGAFLLYPDETLQHAGVVIGLGGVAGHSHKYFKSGASGYFNMLRTVNNYSAVTAACMMVRRSVFENAGGFDEQLAVAFNDVDLCLKIRAEGFFNVCLPYVRLYHYESKSRGSDESPVQSARFLQEIEIMKNRWHTDGRVDPFYSPHLSMATEDFGIRLHAPRLFMSAPG